MDTKSTISLHTGHAMPVIGLGTWQLTRHTAESVEAALRMGYRMIDTSGDYGTQPGIADAIERGGIERAALYIVTKVEEDEDAYDSAIKNVQELGLDYVDLLLIHRPPTYGSGTELWQGLIQAKIDGLTRDIGVSNYAPEQINALIAATGEVPVINQIEWSPFGYSTEMLRFAKEHNMIIQAYSPLTRGKRLNDEILKPLAETYKKTSAQILLRWNIQLGTVPLPKAAKEEYMRENIDVFDFVISEEDMQTLTGLNEHFSAFGSLPYISA